MSAASSDGEEQNYWPGYVDALTTMLMVLTFVMMVLGVVVFTLSQNVSRNIVETMARAAKVDLSRVENTTPDQLTKAVLNAIAEKLERSGDVSGSAQKSGAPVTPAPPVTSEATPPLPVEAAEARPLQPATALEPSAGPANALTTAEPGAQSPASALESQASIAALPAESITQDKPAAERPMPDVATDVAMGQGGLKIAFKNGSVRMDERGAAEVEAYMRKAGAASVTIRAMAAQGPSGATEARKRAYYRAMLVRARLLQSGAAPSQINVQVRDAAAAPDGDLVIVYAHSGKAP